VIPLMEVGVYKAITGFGFVVLVLISTKSFPSLNVPPTFDENLNHNKSSYLIFIIFDILFTKIIYTYSQFDICRRVEITDELVAMAPPRCDAVFDVKFELEIEKPVPSPKNIYITNHQKIK
jgi:hypothetical protein